MTALLFSYIPFAHSDTTTSKKEDKETIGTILQVKAFSIKSVFYTLGTELCKNIAQSKRFICELTPGNGSIENAKKLLDKKVEAGFVSTVIYDAVKNKYPPFTNYPDSAQLKPLFSLIPSIFFAYTYAGSTIKNFNDAPGHSVDIGHPGSVESTFVQQAFEMKEWEAEQFKSTTQLRTVAFSRQICAKQIDMFIVSTVHPEPYIEAMFKSCNLRIAPMQENFINKMIINYPFYVKAKLPANTYSGQTQETLGLGGQSLFLVHADFNEQDAYLITKHVFENFNANSNPKFSGFNTTCNVTTRDPAQRSASRCTALLPRSWVIPKKLKSMWYSTCILCAFAKLKTGLVTELNSYAHACLLQ